MRDISLHRVLTAKVAIFKASKKLHVVPSDVQQVAATSSCLPIGSSRLEKESLQRLRLSILSNGHFTAKDSLRGVVGTPSQRASYLDRQAIWRAHGYSLWDEA